MRALVISHAYVAEDNRVKWESLAKTGKAEIELHLPHRWPSWEFDYRPTPVSQPHFKIRVSHAFRTGREDQYFFAPKLLRQMRQAHFDVLHVEQGSAAMVYFQSLWERNRFSRKTRTCFFTWINWEPVMRWPWTWIEPYNLRHSDGAIGGNREAVDLLRKHGFRGKTTVIPQLGVDVTKYSPGENAKLRQELKLEGVVVGFIGRLVEEKGIRLLLDASQKLDLPISLLLLGSGPLEPELARLKNHANVRLVHIPAVPHDQVPDYLRAMDILVLPSHTTPRWKEQFGHVLIEAMSCEVPVIGSNSAAIPEVIGNAGLLFQEGRVEELAEHLKNLVQSPEDRKQFGQLGRQRVLEHFTHERIAEQTLDFWKTL